MQLALQTMLSDARKRLLFRNGHQRVVNKDPQPQMSGVSYGMRLDDSRYILR